LKTALHGLLLGEPMMSDVPGPVVILLVVAFLIGFLLRGFLND
jgi:hypothetical protein